MRSCLRYIHGDPVFSNVLLTDGATTVDTAGGGASSDSNCWSGGSGALGGLGGSPGGAAAGSCGGLGGIGGTGGAGVNHVKLVDMRGALGGRRLVHAAYMVTAVRAVVTLLCPFVLVMSLRTPGHR